jgi:hypothetical protein
MAGTAARIIFSSWFQYYYCAMILLNLVAMADNLIEKVCPELNLTTNLSIHNTHKRADAQALEQGLSLYDLYLLHEYKRVGTGAWLRANVWLIVLDVLLTASLVLELILRIMAGNFMSEH